MEMVNRDAAILFALSKHPMTIPDLRSEVVGKTKLNEATFVETLNGLVQKNLIDQSALIRKRGCLYSINGQGREYLADLRRRFPKLIEREELTDRHWTVIRQALIARRDSYRMAREECYVGTGKNRRVRDADGLVANYQVLIDLFGELESEAEDIKDDVDRYIEQQRADRAAE